MQKNYISVEYSYSDDESSSSTYFYAYSVNGGSYGPIFANNENSNGHATKVMQIIFAKENIVYNPHMVVFKQFPTQCQETRVASLPVFRQDILDRKHRRQQNVDKILLVEIILKLVIVLCHVSKLYYYMFSLTVMLSPHHVSYSGNIQSTVSECQADKEHFLNISMSNVSRFVK